LNHLFPRNENCEKPEVVERLVRLRDKTQTLINSFFILVFMADEKPIKDENTLMKERKHKLSLIKDTGVNPYPYSFDKKDNSCDLHKKYDKKLKAHDITKDKAKIAGRVRTLRIMGKASFVDIEDESGKIQLYVQVDNVKNYKLLKKLDIGDWIGCEGTIFKTKTNELTIEVKKLDILCKAMRPMPSNWYGLKDPEIRYRKRELDLIMNKDVLNDFKIRSQAVKYLREYLDKHDFLEVETPALQPVYGGANARPFITKLNALDMTVFLSISPELYLKRLLVGGFERVYTYCKNFRNEGVDKSHNPEFSMMECYAAYWDYNDMMKFTEEMYEYIVKKITGDTKVKYEDKTIDFKAPWAKITMYDLVKKFTKINVEKLNKEEILAEVAKKKLKIDYDEKWPKGLIVTALYDEYCEHELVQPTHVIDHPKETSPLCKIHRDNPELIERFEPVCSGMELGNAYSELNDPAIQRKHFKEQLKMLKKKGDPHPLDEGYVEALEAGMPPAAGLGIGFDRLVMFLTNSHSIRDVILFPFMKKLD
jgi:lysyl-tRNA synthetase, class II